MATSLNPNDVLIGTAEGPGIYMAPVGTAAPTDSTTVLPATWSTLGYLSEDGVTLSQDTTSADIIPWQGRSPVRSMITARELAMEMTMIEFNQQNLAVYFGMPVTTGVPASTWALDVISTAPTQVYSFVIDVADLDVKLRYYIPRGSLSDAGDLVVTDSGAMALPITMKCLDDNGTLLSIMYTDGSATGLTTRSVTTTTKAPSA